MLNMALLRNNYIELEGSIQKVFDAFIKHKKDYIPSYFKVKKSNRSVETHMAVGNLSEMTIWNGAVTYQEFNKGYENSYRHLKYSTGVKVERELIMFENFNEIEKRANRTAQAVYKTLQNQAAGVWNNAFTTFKSPDTKALCATDHKITSLDAVTQSNKGSYELTVPNLNTVMTAMRLFKDDKGDVMDIEGRHIICGENLRKEVTQILGSTKEAHTADNDLNYYDGLTFEVNPRIDGNKWFLVDKDVMKGGDGLNWYNTSRNPYKVEYQDDFDSEVGKYKSVGLWSWGTDSWYFVYGNDV
jgi:phage major head subunit gpT-like protein